MKFLPTFKPLVVALSAAGLLALGAVVGSWWSRQQPAAPATTVPGPVNAVKAERKPLYWYDPMVPATRFDKPGKSPFMDMDLVPMYADEDGSAGGTVRIAAEVTQNLGMRLAKVVRASSAEDLTVSGVVGFNERDVAIVQARTGGFVERVGALAPGDVVQAGALLAELLVPEWAAVQQEALALRRLQQPDLSEAAVQRMRLAGMPEALIEQVLSSGQVRNRVSIVAPRAGVIQELEVRAGMNLMAGATLARINGLSTVWLEAAVPEARAAQLRVGQRAKVALAALPGQTVEGRVNALLPALNEATRSLRVRVELPNPRGLLRPGLSAQVSLQGGAVEGQLAVPIEAVIRTGQRSLVMVAEPAGRYRPVEVQLGGEVGSLSLIRSGLQEGQQVVASGQFLLDSEANLKGIRPTQATDAAALHEAEATVDGIEGLRITLSHGPFKTLNMPGMTMSFPLASAQAAQGIQAGDRVRVGVQQTEQRLLVQRIEKLGAQK